MPSASEAQKIFLGVTIKKSGPTFSRKFKKKVCNSKKIWTDLFGKILQGNKFINYRKFIYKMSR